jgi:hypothetical protein
MDYEIFPFYLIPLTIDFGIHIANLIFTVKWRFYYSNNWQRLLKNFTVHLFSFIFIVLTGMKQWTKTKAYPWEVGFLFLWLSIFVFLVFRRRNYNTLLFVAAWRVFFLRKGVNAQIPVSQFREMSFKFSWALMLVTTSIFLLVKLPNFVIALPALYFFVACCFFLAQLKTGKTLFIAMIFASIWASFLFFAFHLKMIIVVSPLLVLTIILLKMSFQKAIWREFIQTRQRLRTFQYV